MKNSTDGKDLLFAGAAAVWGMITVYRSLQGWREENRRTRSASACAVHALPLGRLDLPTAVVTGALTTLGSLAYLVWFFLL